MTMIEQVARALDVHVRVNVLRWNAGLSHAQISEWCETLAGAAVEAMREPNPEMLHAAGKWWEACLHNSKVGWENGEIIYLAMIDAALSEKP